MYDMLFGVGSSGFGWDSGKKLVTAENSVWDEYIKVFQTYSREISGNSAMSPHLDKFHGIVNDIDPVLQKGLLASIILTASDTLAYIVNFLFLVEPQKKSVAHYLIQMQQQQTISGDLSSSKSTSAEDSSCVHNDPEENKSKVENGKITEENYSSIEAGVISSDEHSAKNAAAKKANKSLEDVNPAIDSIASRLRKGNIA